MCKKAGFRQWLPVVQLVELYSVSFLLPSISVFNLFIYVCSLQHECVYKEKTNSHKLSKGDKKKKNFCKTLPYLF